MQNVGIFHNHKRTSLQVSWCSARSSSYFFCKFDNSACSISCSDTDGPPSFCWMNLPKEIYKILYMKSITNHIAILSVMQYMILINFTQTSKNRMISHWRNWTWSGNGTFVLRQFLNYVHTMVESYSSFFIIKERLLLSGNQYLTYSDKWKCIKELG